MKTFYLLIMSRPGDAFLLKFVETSLERNATKTVLKLGIDVRQIWRTGRCMRRHVTSAKIHTCFLDK